MGVPYLSPQQIDELPLGLIELDGDATVLVYNRAEADLAHLKAESVIGRNFFTEIAPCTAVKEFQGRFNVFRASNEKMRRFNFTFHFAHGETEVEIVMVRRDNNRIVFVVRKVEP